MQLLLCCFVREVHKLINILPEGLELLCRIQITECHQCDELKGAYLKSVGKAVFLQDASSVIEILNY